MILCENCKVKEATKKFDWIVYMSWFCSSCFNLVQRELWLDRIYSADFNCSIGKCLEPWTPEQTKHFLDKNFPIEEPEK